MPSLIEEGGSPHGSSPEEGVRFCTYCARLEAGTPTRRVCSSCGLGVILTTEASVLSRSGEPLLVVGADLRVSAASAAVANLFGRPQRILGVPLAAMISGRAGWAELEQRVRAASLGSSRISTLQVELIDKPAAGPREQSVRIASCADPRAALLVFAGT